MPLRTTAVALAACLLSLLPSATAQCPNEVAQYNPFLRTMSSNTTWMVVPVPKAAAQTAINAAFPGQQLTLLDVPNDPALFPNGFPAGFQPVVINSGLTDDIRITALQIDGGLMQATAYVTYVSKGGSRTPLAAAASGYIAGENGPLPNGLVPALASPLLFAGNPLRLGQFMPQGAGYQSNGNGVYSNRVAWAILPNPISGPGVYPEAYDLIYERTSSSSKYTLKGLKSLINQPILLPSGLCQRNTYYFNNATAQPALTNGNVTIGPGSDGINPLSSAMQRASPDGSGFYANVDGLAGCAQNVGNNPQNCDEAGRQIDPAAL